MEKDQIMDKIMMFLEEKQKLTPESAYFIVKELQELYWERIKQEDDEDFEEEDDFEDSEEENDEDSDDEVDKILKEESHQEGVKKILKRPQIKVKKNVQESEI